MKTVADVSLINLKNSSSAAARKPILVAHRGGVITPKSPDNSRAAIGLAADRVYDMVELDVVEAADTVPVLFHGPQGHLARDCGVDAYVHELTSEELQQINYRESDQTLITLAAALELCREHSLGVMLDVKNYGFNYSDGFFATIADLLLQQRLNNAALSFSQDPLAYRYLGDVLKLALSRDELNKVLVTSGESLEDRWWFGLPHEVSPSLVADLQKRGALVIIAINRFRYPAHAHAVLAGKDITRLAAMGVDGLQIDSIYYDSVMRLTQTTQEDDG